MESATVHPRVNEGHPEIDERDVLDAWDACIRAAPRIDRNPNEYIAVGCDSKGRLLEMVAVHTDRFGWVIYRAFTPPTRKALKELGIARR